MLQITTRDRFPLGKVSGRLNLHRLLITCVVAENRTVGDVAAQHGVSDPGSLPAQQPSTAQIRVASAVSVWAVTRGICLPARALTCLRNAWSVVQA
jgi:hypothetical protein